MFFLTRLHNDEFKLFTRFDKAKINIILSEMKFVKVKKDTTFDVSQGAIFLRGRTCYE